VPYPSASAVVIHYEEALYQVYCTFTFFGLGFVEIIPLPRLGFLRGASLSIQ